MSNLVEEMKRKILKAKEDAYFEKFKNEQRLTLEVPETIDIHKAQLSELGKSGSFSISINNSLLFKTESDTLK